MRRTPAKSAAFSTALIFYSFFVFGFTENLRGPTLSVILQDLELSYTQGGSLFFTFYAGFLASVLILGRISDRRGRGILFVLAGIAITIGLIGYAVATSYGFLIASVSVFGIGIGALEIGGNAEIVELHPEKKARYLNYVALFHSAGAMLAPLAVGLVLGPVAGWRGIYAAAAVLGILLFVWTLVGKSFKAISPATSHEKIPLARMFTPVLLMYYAFIAFAVGTEVGMAAWLVVYLEKVRELSIATASFYLSAFFALIICGRFVGSLFIDRFGHTRSLWTASLCSALCIGCGIFGPSQTVFLLPLSGLFLSIIFPTTTAAITDENSTNTGSVLGVLYTFSTIGALLVPPLIGMVAQVRNESTGFAVIAVTSAMTLVLSIIISISTKKRLGAQV